jgi:hypothetical protein
MGGKRYPGEMSWLLYFSPYLAIIYNKLGKWLKVTSYINILTPEGEVGPEIPRLHSYLCSTFWVISSP